MTTKDFPVRVTHEMQELWLGSSYTDELTVLANDRHDLVGTTPDNTAPDRELTVNDTTVRWEWDTDLTPEQDVQFNDTIVAAKAGMRKEQYADLKAEYTNLKAYYLNPSPTGQESIDAIKDIVKTLKVMLDDDS